MTRYLSNYHKNSQKLYSLGLLKSKVRYGAVISLKKIMARNKKDTTLIESSSHVSRLQETLLARPVAILFLTFT